MEKEKEIPEAVMKEAEGLGNIVEYEGIYHGKEAYGVGTVDKKGMPLPNGYPVYVLFDGEKAELKMDDEGFAIFDHFFSEDG